MKKLLLLFAVLLTTVGVFAQVNYGKRTWTFPATSHEAVSEVPAEIFADFKESYKVETTDQETGEVTTTYTELTNAKVGVFVTDVRVATEGDVTAAFVYNGGNIRMDISGVDLVNASGEVVYSDYHFGFAGGQLVNNVYTLTGVAVGDYTMRVFIPAQKEDVTSATTNDSKGVLTITGAWMYPNEGVYYNIKNVRSNKYVTFKGEGKQFTQESANNGAGSYWHFVEASLDDVKKWNNPWLENGAIPAGVKPYWVYSAACEKGVENVTNGNMASPDMSESYPAKIYYIGVHTKDGKTGLIFRPCHEDGSSWNDDQGKGTALGHYKSDDAGSLWSIELANVADNDLMALGTTAKNEALTAVASYEQAYYFNPTAAQISAARAVINAIDCSTTAKSLMSVVDGVAAAKVAEIASCTTAPKAGDRFIMKNKERSGYLRAYAEDDNVKASVLANDVFALDLVWTLVAAETDGEFKLYNERQGVYVGALSTSNNTAMAYTTDVNQAGVYEVSQNGVYTLFHAKDQDANGYLHLSNWPGKEIVRWDNGGPSQWQLFKAPFELTTDKENPICYAIRSGRDGNYYFTLDANKVKLFNNRNLATDNKTHWFFMLDTDKNLKIYPLSDIENPMGYITVADGNTKLTNDRNAANYAGDTYTLYFNEANAASYNNTTFAFRPTAGDQFVSNHGGTGNYMGFYNQYNDHGTRVAFEAVSYHVLKQKIEGATSIYEHEGNKVNQYFVTEETKTAVSEATITLYAKTSNSDDFTTAANSFVMPSINQPEHGKFYRLRCAGGEKRYVSSVISNSRLEMSEQDATNPNYMFVYDATQGNTGLLSYSQGKYITTHALNEIGSKTSVVFTSAQNGVLGQYNISVGNRYIYGRGNTQDNHIDSGTGSPTNANELGYNWCLEEVTTLPVTITSAGYATFYCPVAVTLPNSLEAYYVGETTNNSAKMTPIEGVIPANTGVILKGDANTYNFNIVADVDPVADNMLAGTVASTYVAEDAYVLSKVNEVVGFNKAAKNQQNNSSWLNNAFKAYLPANAVTTAGARFLVFDFGGTETAIEGIGAENTADEVVYDLAGRRVQNAQKGVFIVNGKVVVK